jgi:hypothetical protein
MVSVLNHSEPASVVHSDAWFVQNIRLIQHKLGEYYIKKLKRCDFTATIKNCNTILVTFNKITSELYKGFASIQDLEKKMVIDAAFAILNHDIMELKLNKRVMIKYESGTVHMYGRWAFHDFQLLRSVSLEDYLKTDQTQYVIRTAQLVQDAVYYWKQAFNMATLVDVDHSFFKEPIPDLRLPKLNLNTEANNVSHPLEKLSSNA